MTRYATTTNLVRLGIRAEALSGVATAVQEEALDAASAVADGYLRARGYVLPITAWSADLTRAVAILAAFDLLVTRGFDPQAGADDVLLRRVARPRARAAALLAARMTHCTHLRRTHPPPTRAYGHPLAPARVPLRHVTAAAEASSAALFVPPRC